ncbi:MAG: class I SAM-dependent methyltransferase [Candidatus Thorarchaeota archaeon]
MRKRTLGLLGDSPKKDYIDKLDVFNQFAAPELRQVISDLQLSKGDAILDAGCGTGLISMWLAQAVAPSGSVLGIDLSQPHVFHAQRRLIGTELPVSVVQGDISRLPIADRSFDMIWCSNTIHHLRSPVHGTRLLVEKLRPNGRLVLGQSAFLPEMFFAWNARLEKEVMLACRQYYRDKYGLDERDTAAVRNLLGWLKRAGLTDVSVRTIVIERTGPLCPEDEVYFLEGVFKGYWGDRLRPYLSPEDWAELEQLCNPDSPQFCLRRPDFHHVQTFTVAVGEA